MKENKHTRFVITMKACEPKDKHQINMRVKHQINIRVLKKKKVRQRSIGNFKVLKKLPVCFSCYEFY